MFLGDFGAAIKELDPNQEKDTFNFFGETFEVVEQMPPILVFEVGQAMGGHGNENDAMTAMWRTLKVSLGDGFQRFYELAITKKADERSLMELVMSLFEATGGERPTVQVPDSPIGQSPTSPSSSTSVSTAPVSGEVVLTHDPSVPHLVPVSRVLAG